MRSPLLSCTRRTKIAARAAAACYFRADGRWSTRMAPPPGSVIWSSLRLTPAKLVASALFYRALAILFTAFSLIPIIAINGISSFRELSVLLKLGDGAQGGLSLFASSFVPGLLLVLFYAVVCW